MGQFRRRARSLLLSADEPAVCRVTLSHVFPVHAPFPCLRASSLPSDLVTSALTMIQNRADRCIDLNDHGQLRGRVTLGKEEAASWPWSLPSPRATTSATSGRPRGRPAP